MPTARERSCSEKEVQAIRFNHNEQRCLEKKISGLKSEGACSIQLINQTHKHIKVSYKNLKGKVSKIKTNLSVKEIDKFRKLEDEGKIEVFKSIAKPDSAKRISSYAKRLQIEYDESNQGTTAKHSDDIIAINPFCDEQLSRKDILLRQISDLNDRFNIKKEKERELERKNLPQREISFVKVFKNCNKSESDCDIDLCSEIETSIKVTPRPSTAFDFSDKETVNEISRPATSLGSVKSTTLNTSPTKTTSSLKTTRSMKIQPTKQTEYYNDCKDIKIGQRKNNQVRRVKSLSVNSKTNSQKADIEHASNLSHEPTFKTVVELDESVIDKNIGLLDLCEPSPKTACQKNNIKDSHLISNRINRSQSMKDQTTNQMINEKRPKTSVERSLTTKQGKTSSKVSKKLTSKVTHSTPISTERSNNASSITNSRAFSALSMRKGEAWTNLMTSMNGPQRAPFDCHAAAEKEQKELASSTAKSKPEEGRTKFLSHDSIEGNLGQDLHEELRKGLLEEEETNAMKIEDKICSFMERLAPLKPERTNEPWMSRRNTLTLDEVMTGQREDIKQKRVNVRRQNRFSEDQQRKLEQIRYKNNPESWKDVNKCRYLRIDESKIDLSGMKTLAADQLGLFNGVRYGVYEASV